MPIIKDTAQIPGPLAGDNGQSSEQENDPRLSWSVILDAPEIASFLKREETPRAKEYRGKVNSVFNTLLQFRLADPNGLADVSAILQRGPAVSLQAGALADSNEGFRKALDVVTAPDNPAILFAVAMVPLVFQVFRNHEGELQEVREKRAARKTMSREEKKAARAAKPRVEFRLLGRTWRLPFRFKVNLSGVMRMNTVPPEYLVSSVIGDPKVRSELSKRFGVKWDASPADR